MPDLVEVEAGFGVGVELELGGRSSCFSAVRTDIYFSSRRTLGDRDVQVVQIHAGEVVPLACHDDLLRVAGPNGEMGVMSGEL